MSISGCPQAPTTGPQLQLQTRHRPGVCGRWIRSFPRPRTPVGRGRRSLVALSGSGSGARQTCMLSKQASKQASSSSSDVTVAATGSASCRVSARSDSEPAIDRSIYLSEPAGGRRTPGQKAQAQAQSRARGHATFRSIHLLPSMRAAAVQYCTPTTTRDDGYRYLLHCFVCTARARSRQRPARRTSRRCRVTGRSQPSSPAGPAPPIESVSRRQWPDHVASSIDGLLLLHRYG